MIGMKLRIIALLGGLVISAAAQSRPTLEGKVVTSDGKPLAGARVSIATAAVRKGTSPY